MASIATEVPDTAQIEPRKIAAGIISDNMDADTKARISYLTRMLQKMATANKQGRMFSHAVIYFHKVEILKPSPIFKVAEDLGLEIIADTMNTNFGQVKSAAEYVDLILSLIDLKVSMGRIDDANTKPETMLLDMLADVPGWRWILSSGVNASPAMSSLAQGVDADTKVSAQAYLNGADISFFRDWMKTKPMWSIDFESYRTPKGYMTTPDEITQMGDEVIKAKKRRVMVYALKDQHTDFLAPETINGKKNPKWLGPQWAALQGFLTRWWAEV
jgi:hypothetical protein